MTVRITGVAACRAELEEIRQFVESPEPMRGLVEEVKAKVLEKTAAGHDYRGRNFAPYSDAYKKRRAEKGFQTKPNLSVSGTMLGAIKTAVLTPRHGRVYVDADSDGRLNADVLAQIHNTGTGTQPERRFMDITPSAASVLLKKYFSDPIMAIVRRYR